VETLTIYAIVTDNYETDGIPALFMKQADAKAYAQELNNSGIEEETYIVAETTVVL